MSKRMATAAAKWAACVMIGLGGSWAHAAVIHYELSNISGDTWRYDYVVSQEAFESDSIESFAIFFDLGLYSDLVLEASPWDWDGLVAQPDPGLPDDGFVDWLDLSGVGIAPGFGLAGFSVSFTWLGLGLPGVQYFEVYDADTFGLVGFGLTQLAAVPPPTSVPEPGSLGLLCLATAGAAMLRRHRRSGRT